MNPEMGTGTSYTRYTIELLEIPRFMELMG